MMLAHPQMDSVLCVDAERVCTLVVENPPFFRKLLRDIHQQIRGFPGETVLSKNDVPVDFGKNAEIIDSFLSFEICRKNLITKIISHMESVAVDELHYMKTASMLGKLERYLAELSFDLPCSIVCDKLSIGGVIKAAGIAISDDYGNDLERLLDYMELIRELERDKLFIFVNLRSYYSDDDISAFLDSVLQHAYQVLLIDGVSRKKLQNEQRTTIDMDLCEF